MIYEDDRVDLERSAFINPDVSDERSVGVRLVPKETDDRNAFKYNLAPLQDVERRVNDFTGPNLVYPYELPTLRLKGGKWVFEILIEGFTRSIVTPWESDWYEDSTVAVDHIDHREYLSNKYDLELVEPSKAITFVQAVKDEAEGRLREEYEKNRDRVEDLGESLDDAVTITKNSINKEVVGVFDSPETKAVPSSGGILAATSLEPGEHRLTVQGDDYAPYVERFELSAGGSYPAGVSGNLFVVPDDKAVKVGGRGSEGELERVKLTEDFAGPVYDSKVEDNGTFALCVHQAGRYTIEVTDSEGETGRYRINPNEDTDSIVIDDMRTGKSPQIQHLIEFLEDLIDLTTTLVDADTDADRNGQGRSRGNNRAENGKQKALTAKYEAARSSAERALSFAEDGRGDQANNQLGTVENQLEAAVNHLDSEGGQYADGVVVIISERTNQGLSYVDQAREARIE